MPRTRTLAALVLSLVLVSSPALAVPPEPGFMRGGAPSAATRGETFLLRLWGWLMAGWTKEGCISDPDGRCNKGAISDPSVAGSPAGAGPTKEGCGSDPSGSPCTGKP